MFMFVAFNVNRLLQDLVNNSKNPAYELCEGAPARIMFPVWESDTYDPNEGE